MSRQALNGKSASKTNDADTARKSREDVIAPLDFTLSVMHDEAQPTALRASMARAALPFVHGRRAPTPPPSSHDELRARAQASLSALSEQPSNARSPRRWKKQLQDATAKAEASEAEAQRHAALLHAAETRAQAADILTRELEKTLLAAQTRAREMEERSKEMEERALAAEAMAARLKKSKAKIVTPAQESVSRVADDEAREQLATAQHRARRAEMLAYDMEQRALAAEEIIARSR